jgi:hypothetical protein
MGENGRGQQRTGRLTSGPSHPTQAISVSSKLNLIFELSCGIELF